MRPIRSDTTWVLVILPLATESDSLFNSSSNLLRAKVEIALSFEALPDERTRITAVAEPLASAFRSFFRLTGRSRILGRAGTMMTR